MPFFPKHRRLSRVFRTSLRNGGLPAIPTRYKLNLTLEKMSPVLKGTMEIRVKVSGGEGEKRSGGAQAETRPVWSVPPIILDWRKIKGFEDRSKISNVSLNGKASRSSTRFDPTDPDHDPDERDFRGFIADQPEYTLADEHIVFNSGVVVGENVIKLDFTSPILTSGSAITRYVDKEDGAEYIYSLFVPSDASTAFPVFDQPDLKARFELSISYAPPEWQIVTNSGEPSEYYLSSSEGDPADTLRFWTFPETKPISTYVFAFAAGPWERVSVPGAVATGDLPPAAKAPVAMAPGTDKNADGNLVTSIYVRKSQAAKFKPHAAEVFRLNREGIKFLEQYFDYKFPFPKYDIVLIPEFPFGGMEHAGATFLRESSVIFPQEPTKNDYISRANLIFHEAAHQWFGDTVTMKWFDDLWLKEGFAEFMAYKTLEKVMPEYNAWKVFYERNKQAAYLTDSTKGTTPIYQEIANLSAAKSAYGNIVYRKAPSFLRQAEFYIGPNKFQTAVRAFLKKHEFGNAGWADLVKEFETASGFEKNELNDWAKIWIQRRGLGRMSIVSRISHSSIGRDGTHYSLQQTNDFDRHVWWPQKMRLLILAQNNERIVHEFTFGGIMGYVDGMPDKTFLAVSAFEAKTNPTYKILWDGSDILVGRGKPAAIFPNYQDYGYGIFLLDDKSRDYVLKNIQNEKDDFLRTMMWGSLWDSVREGELDPREYVELVVKNLGKSDAFTRATTRRTTQPGVTKGGGVPQGFTPEGVTLAEEQDESTIQTLLSRVSTAMNYYLPTEKAEPPASAGGKEMGVKPTSEQPASMPPAHAGGSALSTRLEDVLIDRMQNAPTLGQRITFYRAFLNIASTEKARGLLKRMLNESVPGAVATGSLASARNPVATAPGTDSGARLPLRVKDRFDIVTRLLILGDPEAPALLAGLEKTETSDEAKRYAYAARAGVATAENKAKYWNDFTANKDISESWIEVALGPFNSVRHAELTLPYLERALKELPNHKRSRKIFFVNGWLSAFIGGQRSEQALAIVNKFLADNPNLDNDLRLKILENVDLIERAVKIRAKYGKN